MIETRSSIGEYLFMKLDLDLKIEKVDVIDVTMPVPMSSDMKKDIDALKKVCGKSVNQKIREFLCQLLEENKDKIKKAS